MPSHQCSDLFVSKVAIVVNFHGIQSKFLLLLCLPIELEAPGAKHDEEHCGGSAPCHQDLGWPWLGEHAVPKLDDD